MFIRNKKKKKREKKNETKNRHWNIEIIFRYIQKKKKKDNMSITKLEPD